MNMTKFNDLRQRIDEADGRLIAAWQDRMAAVDELGRLKMELGLPIFDAEREEDLLLYWLERSGNDPSVQLLLNTCLNASKLRQKKLREAENQEQ